MLNLSRTSQSVAPILAIAASLAACSAQSQTPPAPLTPVEASVRQGALRGSFEDGVRIFKGVPYAQPPVGDLRWRPPQAPQAWTGVRDAQGFGSDCMQNRVGWDDTQTKLPVSEDCLTLNVWTPDGAKAAPVMVWIHGGGYVMGSGSQPVFNGAALAKRGVVVVTFNYRLGRFGFFAHSALSAEHADEPKANYGYMDQMAALAWVKANIAALGGDPKRVTIFGQSAGGGSAAQMMLIPAARDLFQQAIVQSGGGRDVWPLLATDRPGKSSAEAIGAAFAEKAGAKDAAALRALPAAKLLGKLDLLNMEEATFSGPVVDGRLVTGSAVEGFAAGRQAKVPLLIGANSDELGIIPSFLKGTFAGRTIAQLGLPEDRLLAIYGSKSALNNDMPGDATFVEPAHALAQRAAQSGQPVWAYSFGYVAQAKRKDWRGAPHSSDLGYVFDNLDKLKNPPAAADQAMAKRWADVWVAFARSGDPGWAHYDPATDQRMTVTDNDAALAATPERIKALGALRDASSH